MGCIGMCGPKGYGFSASIGNTINHSVVMVDRFLIFPALVWSYDSYLLPRQPLHFLLYRYFLGRHGQRRFVSPHLHYNNVHYTSPCSSPCHLGAVFENHGHAEAYPSCITSTQVLSCKLSELDPQREPAFLRPP